MAYDSNGRWIDERREVIGLSGAEGSVKLESGHRGTCRVSLIVDSVSNGELSAGVGSYEYGRGEEDWPIDGVMADGLSGGPAYVRAVIPADEVVELWWAFEEVGDRCGEVVDYSEDQKMSGVVVVDPNRGYGPTLGSDPGSGAHVCAIRFNPGTSDFRRESSELSVVSPAEEGGTEIPGVYASAEFGESDNAAVRAVIEVKAAGAIGTADRLGDCEADEGNMGSMTFEADADTGFEFADAIAHTYVLACTTAGDLSATPPVPIGVTLAKDGVVGQEVTLSDASSVVIVETTGGKSLSISVGTAGSLALGDCFTVSVAGHPMVSVNPDDSEAFDAVVPLDGKVVVGGGVTAVFAAGSYAEGGDAVITTPARGSYCRYLDGQLIGTDYIVGDGTDDITSAFGDVATLKWRLFAWREYAPTSGLEDHGCKFDVSDAGCSARFEVEMV